MKKQFLSVFTLLFVVFSCGGSFDRQAEVDQILDLHDEVMPKIGEVMNLKKKALAKAADLEAKDSTDVKINALRTLAEELENARKAMMKWMNDWSKDSKPHVKGESSIAEQKSFFADEVVRITKVKDDINNSIAAAKEVFK